jgi:hypothetical protein
MHWVGVDQHPKHETCGIQFMDKQTNAIMQFQCMGYMHKTFSFQLVRDGFIHHISLLGSLQSCNNGCVHVF